MNQEKNGTKWAMWVVGTGMVTSFLIQSIYSTLGMILLFWSVVIVAGKWGFMASVLCVVFPIISQAVLALYLWANLGFWNPFTMACVSYVALVAISIGLFFSAGMFAEKFDRDHQ